jgi:hypothetical protein
LAFEAFEGERSGARTISAPRIWRPFGCMRLDALRLWHSHASWSARMRRSGPERSAFSGLFAGGHDHPSLVGSRNDAMLRRFDLSVGLRFL